MRTGLRSLKREFHASLQPKGAFPRCSRTISRFAIRKLFFRQCAVGNDRAFEHSVEPKGKHQRAANISELSVPRRSMNRAVKIDSSSASRVLSHRIALLIEAFPGRLYSRVAHERAGSPHLFAESLCRFASDSRASYLCNRQGLVIDDPVAGSSHATSADQNNLRTQTLWRETPAFAHAVSVVFEYETRTRAIFVARMLSHTCDGPNFSLP